MKRYVFIFFLCAVSLNVFAQNPSLSLDATRYTPGATITVQFTAPSSYSSDAWVGIIPSNVAHGSENKNDQHDIAYLYLEKKTRGTLTFTAPSNAGKYDIRMHDTDNNGKEVASVTFTVSSFSSEIDRISIPKKIYKPGEKVIVTFSAPDNLPSDAWIGIIPSKIPHGSEAENDKHDIEYQYLNKKTTGVLTFTVPDSPGSYDFRMHDTDNDGNEIGYVTFIVQ